MHLVKGRGVVNGLERICLRMIQGGSVPGSNPQTAGIVNEQRRDEIGRKAGRIRFIHEILVIILRIVAVETPGRSNPDIAQRIFCETGNLPVGQVI